jgi:hypothetical protein
MGKTYKEFLDETTRKQYADGLSDPENRDRRIWYKSLWKGNKKTKTGAMRTGDAVLKRTTGNAYFDFGTPSSRRLFKKNTK